MACTPPPGKAGRRRAALISGGLGLALVVGAGIWASQKLDEADRTSPTRYWVGAGNKPAVPSSPVPTVPPNELMAKLLPLPAGYELGPDLDLEGNNFYVPGERAIQSLKDSRTGLSGSQRAERDRALADLKLKGLAGRTFNKRSGAPVTEIHLTQADPQALATFSDFSKKWLDLLSGDREAPKIDGFPQAKCVLSDVLEEEAKDKKGQIDSLECVAVEGDVLVEFRTYGAKISTNEAADLFKQQLNHLKSPGESV
ncbi:hypothetical protein AMK16_31580 [Streptomyces sp. CB00455]|nr:hypothetical protein AMK16_31580 [Streptomyces sp. CB00455]